MAHGKLLTNLERKRRHLSDNASCPRCAAMDESIMHVTRDCPFASEVWDKAGVSTAATIQTETDFECWFTEVLKHDKALDIKILCWYLWKARNELVFNQAVENPQSIVAKAGAWTATVKAALGDSNGRVAIPIRNRTNVSWEPGLAQWHVLNTDGSVLPQLGSAAAGGVLRDESGRGLAAFSANLGRCSITRAELRGIMIGLDVAWEVGIRKVAVQVDSKAAISLINEPGVPCQQHAAEVVAILKLLQPDWEVTIAHIYREGNKAADYLASIGHNLPLGTQSIPVSDCNLGYFLRYDCMGISEPRIIRS
ncbi:Putative ribonuclease H protein At1g65750 [Linum perenne]